MNETMKMLQALGLYILFAKNGGKTKADCIAAQDYHEFLSPFVAAAEAMKGMFNFNAGNPLKPLADITLTINEYCDIVRQIYDQGITQMNALNLPYPVAAAPAVAHAATTYFGNYLRTLGNDPRTPADVDSIVGRINELMMHQTGASPRVTGLVVGRVQSGKTRNYVGLALKAIDEGWNTIIVLTSCSTALADQTEERLLDDFRNAGMLHGPGFMNLNFRSSDPVAEPMALGQADYVYVGVAMKQRDNLDHILGWLGRYPDRVKHMRLLLIDDEADNATPDSNCGKKNQLDDDDIDELVDDTAAEENGDEGTFLALSNWIAEVRNSRRLNEEEMPWKEIVSSLREKLKDTKDGDVDAMFGYVLGDPDSLRLLGLDENTEALRLIPLYFNGNGPRSPKHFLKFLNALLDVGVARSAINERICRLVALSETTGEYNYKFSKFAYIAYTATPYANILNERSDQTPLYPDFIKSLQEAPQYFGLDKIFGEDETVVRPKMNIVNLIPKSEDGKTTQGEVRFILRPIQGIRDFEPPREVLTITGPDTELNVRCAAPQWSGRWNTLREAVAWLYCSAAARRWYRRVELPRVLDRQGVDAAKKAKKLNAMDARWTTMLMNISQIRDVHKMSKELLDRFLAYCCLPANEAAFLAECEKCWGDMIHRFTKSDFDNLFDSGNPSDNYSSPNQPICDYPNWDEIIEDVRYFIRGTVAPLEKNRKVHTVVVNSENRESRENQDFYYQRLDQYKPLWKAEHKLDDDQAWIMCGGNTISRGLTLMGLTASYFDRVRKTATCDTLTQMGRWFGFRMGYELYPRIWMTQETVTEMKRICMTENRMHETMRENFDAGYSPSDPAHYQQVYYWGRRLSGRQRQLDLSGAPVGTTGITDDISYQSGDVSAVYAAAKGFVGMLGPVSSRSQVDYQYYRNPMWSDVRASDVISFLGQVKNHYPENSKRKIESLAKELLTAGITAVDVVIGEPSSPSQRGGKTFPVAPNIPAHNGILEPGKVRSGFPQQPTDKGGAYKYNSLRTHTAFFSMLKRTALIKADLDCLNAEKKRVMAQLRDNAAANGGLLSAQFENTFAAVGLNNGSIEQRLDGYIHYLDGHPKEEMSSCIHQLLSAGSRTRASTEYCERAHANAQHETPVVQLYFVNPPDGKPQEEPYVSISFYWPKHPPSHYQMGTVAAPPPGQIDVREIYGVIGDILRKRMYPMTSEKLKSELMLKYPAESESIYYMNVVDGQTFAGYRQFPGKHAYYSLRWCGNDNPVDKINSEVRTVALDIIRRQRRNFRSQEIVDAITRENPRFAGIVTLTTTILNQQILTDEVLAANNISKVSANPVLYRMN